jgi:C4-type Zn-finger protein
MGSEPVLSKTWHGPCAQGSLGGFFTSVEGLLAKVKSHLVEGNPFGSGDSATKHHSEEESAGAKFRAFMARLDDVVEGRVFPFTIKLQVRCTRVLTCLIARDAR